MHLRLDARPRPHIKRTLWIQPSEEKFGDEQKPIQFALWSDRKGVSLSGFRAQDRRLRS